MLEEELTVEEVAEFRWHAFAQDVLARTPRSDGAHRPLLVERMRAVDEVLAAPPASLRGAAGLLPCWRVSLSCPKLGVQCAASSAGYVEASLRGLLVVGRACFLRAAPRPFETCELTVSGSCDRLVVTDVSLVGLARGPPLVNSPPGASEPAAVSEGSPSQPFLKLLFVQHVAAPTLHVDVAPVNVSVAPSLFVALNSLKRAPPGEDDLRSAESINGLAKDIIAASKISPGTSSSSTRLRWRVCIQTIHVQLCAPPGKSEPQTLRVDVGAVVVGTSGLFAESSAGSSDGKHPRSSPSASLQAACAQLSMRATLRCHLVRSPRLGARDTVGRMTLLEHAEVRGRGGSRPHLSIFVLLIPLSIALPTPFLSSAIFLAAANIFFIVARFWGESTSCGARFRLALRRFGRRSGDDYSLAADAARLPAPARYAASACGEGSSVAAFSFEALGAPVHCHGPSQLKRVHGRAALQTLRG